MKKGGIYNTLIISKKATMKILEQLKNNYICKICKLNNNSSTGFFCKIPFFNSTLPVLITSNHVLNKDDIKVYKIIKIVLIEKEIKIVINESRKTFTDEKLDVTIIEIIPKVDGINNFLEIDNDINEKNMKDKIKNVYILQNSNGESSFIGCQVSGFIGQNISYRCDTLKGSSGSPILNLINNKVIGVHLGFSNNLKIGTLMIYIIDSFNKTYEINTSKLNLTEIKPLTNNEFYVGNLENGKIAIYYSDGRLKYEGDRVDGKFEGKGTYYYKNGNHYEGEWKKGLKHGKGILYYDFEDKNKKYEGNFSKGNFEGKGIYYWKDGSYYKGDFLDGLKYGFGEYYKNNGKLKYEGSFINDKFGGKGIYYCKNGDYYMGDFKNGLKHGKGILYNKKGEVIKKGDFVNNKYQDKK